MRCIQASLGPFRLSSGNRPRKAVKAEREALVLHEIFQDPRVPYGNGDGTTTLNIHSPLPDAVKIGHYEAGRSDPVVDEIVGRSEYLERIQQACTEHGEAYQVRFHDHVDQEFDAAILDQLDEIRSLAIETYGPVTHPEAVGRLPKLRVLTFAPRAKTDPGVLSTIGVERLERFTLGETATPPIDLAPLAKAGRLHTLRLLAQGKNTEAIGDCPALKALSLHPSDKIPLDFINRLERLETLKLSLGKTRSIEAVGPLPHLRDLSFDEVGLLEELGDLQRFPALRRLQVNYQRRLKILRVGPANTALEHLNLQGIDEIEGFSDLPALKSLWNFDGRFAPEWAEIPPSVTHFALVPPSLTKREKHFAEVRAHGLFPEQHPDASFFYK
jgi:hypothetical protein